MDHQKAKSIFLHALEEVPPGDWPSYLSTACGDDASLRQNVELLLAAHGENVDLADQAWQMFKDALPTTDQPSLEKPGAQIGPYKLLQQIGEGGFGVVFMAEQTEPVRRKVALKVIKPGMDTRQVIARFEAERQALAVMDHPNIARVLDAGATDSGRPYFVMELVRGTPITQYCDENSLNIRERLALFAGVCQAIQHAHTKGIIHRDIKPTNVLVALQDGHRIVKVIDFGVAKAMGQQLTDKTLFTEFAQMIGTPLYMSPEQAELSSTDIDTRSDIYSLGVLLYELLTGSTPVSKEQLKQATFDEIRRIIREEEPQKPSTRISTADAAPSIAAQRHTEPAKLARLVRGELDWIVMKALEKDRSRRYETASAFAADIDRYLDDEPVQACPPSASYRLRKFVRRNGRALTMAAVAALAVVVGIGSLVGSIGWILGDRAAQREAKGREADYALKQSAQLLVAGNAAQASAWARRAEVVLDGEKPPIELQQRLKEVHADLKMVDEIEEIRIRKSEVKDEHYDFARADPAYKQAFLDYGMDIESLGIEEAAVRLRARNICMDLVLALDDWADVVRWNVARRDPRWKHLLAVARAADSDVQRNQLRAAWEKEPMDRQALEQLATSDRLGELPAPTLFLLSACLKRSGSSETAVTVLRQAQWKYPQDFWVNHNLAFLLMAMSPPRWKEAIPFYTAAVALRPESPGARINLSVALAHAGDQEWRIAILKQASSLKGDYATAYLNLGNALLNKQMRPEAIVALREAIRLKPDSTWAHNTLGLALEATGQVDEAIDCYHKAIDLEPNLSQPHFHLAYALLVLKGDRAGAVDAANEGLRHPPRYSMEALPCSGLAYRLALQPDVEKKEAEFAVELGKRAVSLGPRLGHCWTALGMAHYRACQWDAAITALEEANTFFSGGGSFEWFFLAMAHWQRGDQDEAQRAFARAVQWAQSNKTWFEADKSRQESLCSFRAEAEQLLGPENVQAALNRPNDILKQARQHVLARRWRDAAPLYAESQQWSTDEDAVWYERAAVLLLSGDVESFRRLRDAYLQQPAPTGIGTRLYFRVRLVSFAPVERDEVEQAVELAERALAAKIGVLNTNNAGYAYYRAGKFDLAINQFERSLHDWGEDAGRVINWPGLALAHFRLGNESEAGQWLAKSVVFAKENRDGTIMHIHHWLVFHVWLREAERVIGQVDRQPSQ